MKILVACEESQAVTKEFRRLGHEAYSCDVEPCSGGHPEWHLQQDVIPLLKEKWDMIIAFPPCTHLAVSGARWFKEKQADGRQREAIDFFMEFANAPCGKIAIENPVGIMSTVWRKPDQIIQPWQFGDSFQKTTCLWLKGLPPLEATNIVDKGEFVIHKSGKKKPKWYADAFHLPPKERAKVRSQTYPGIARAMAEQWGRVVIMETDWGYPAEIKDIFFAVGEMLGGDVRVLFEEPWNIIWGDKKMANEHIDFCLNVDQGDLSHETFMVLRWSLHRLKEIPLSVRTGVFQPTENGEMHKRLNRSKQCCEDALKRMDKDGWMLR